MKIEDFEAFANAWNDAHEVMAGGKVLSAGAMGMVIRALEAYPLAAILAALNRHVQTAKFAPTPSDIVALLSPNLHVGADEAWAIAVESMDEGATVVMTGEIVEARAAALPIWEIGDEVGARMAFREAYNRIVKTAPQPRWHVSLGFDVGGRTLALTKAVESGRLTREEASRHLPAPQDGGPIGKLLTGKVADMPSNDENLRKRWAGLKQAMLDGQAKLDGEKLLAQRQAEEKRLKFEQKRKSALDAVSGALKKMAVGHE